MALKNFLAKLVSWNSNQNKGWEGSAAKKFQADNQRESNFAKEEELRRKQNLRQDGIIPRPESSSTVDLTPELSEKPETAEQGQ